MPRVLAYTSPALGHLYPMVPLLLELHRRGHEVHVRTHPGQLETLRALGLRAEAVDPAIAERTEPDYETRSPRKAMEIGVRTFVARGEVDGPDLARAVARIEPDLLVVDGHCWGACSAAEGSGLPWVRFSSYTPPLVSRGTPPFGPGWLPRTGLLGRVRDALARPVVHGLLERMLLPRLNDLRGRLGVPPTTSIEAFFRSADRMLVATAEPFEYPHPDWGPSVVMIGASSWEPPTPTPPWLAEIDGPLVLVTTSSEYQADEELVRAAIAGLTGQGWTVVATMPAGLVDLGPLPDDVRVVEFVPHGQVLDRAVAAVTHGGMGATQKALSHEVPVVVVPFGRDQLEVAARVITADAGVRLPVTQLGPETLRDAVQRAQAHRPGAERVAAGFAAAGGAVTGADVCEALLAAAAHQA